VAHFLLEMLTRLQAVGLADERSYRLPLTQELLADALGLSVQYVNLTLRQLREEVLASVERQQVTILNPEGLAALADFERSYINRIRLTEFDAQHWPAPPGC
jgi:AraC-like DNA-binding protein